MTEPKKTTRDMALAEVTRALEAAFPGDEDRVRGILAALDVSFANDVLREIEREVVALRAANTRTSVELLSARDAVGRGDAMRRLAEADPDFAIKARERLREIDRAAARKGKPRHNVQERKRRAHSS